MTEDLDSSPLAQLDASERARLGQVEDVVARVLRVDRPATILELRTHVRQQLGDVENSLIRAAVLRLLNANRLREDHPTARATVRGAGGPES